MKREKGLVVCILVSVVVLFMAIPCSVLAKDNVVEIRALVGHPKEHIAMTPMVEWVNRVEARTAGKVKVKVFWGTMGKVTEFYDMVKDGVVDMAALGTGWAGGRLPMCEIVDLPFESPDVVTGSKVLNTLYQQGLLKELDLFKVMELHSMITGNLFLNDKKVTSLDQITGLKIRPIPGVSTELVESWKAVPVAVRTPDLYMALQKRQIDGFFTGPDNAVGQKLYEVCKYQVKIPTFSGAFAVLMNKKKWNQLPPDVQKNIDDVNEEIHQFRLDFYQKLAGEANGILGEKLEAYSLSPAEQARWKKAAEGVTEKWIAAMEKKGLPGGKAVEVMRSIVAESK